MKTAEEQDVCVFCGSPDRDKKTDHLRQVYKLSQDRLDIRQYHPRLYSYELDKLQLGSSSVCSNIRKCRDRRVH